MPSSDLLCINTRLLAVSQNQSLISDLHLEDNIDPNTQTINFSSKCQQRVCIIAFRQVFNASDLQITCAESLAETAPKPMTTPVPVIGPIEYLDGTDLGYDKSGPIRLRAEDMTHGG